MADQKISELAELLTPAAADLLAIVDDPAGTPETKKVTVENILDLVPAGGDVSKVGTPVNNELGVWTGDGTLEGEEDLTFDGSLLTMQDLGLVGPVIQDYGIANDPNTPTGTAVTLDYTDGPAFEIDLESATGTVTATLSNAPASGTYGQMIVRVQQDGTTPIGLSWAGGTFLWPDGTEHIVTSDADGVTLFMFETWDGGTTWHAAGADYS